MCQSCSWSDLCATEAALIRQLDTRHPSGYNMSDGGEGPFGVKRNPESVERSASKHRGRPCHPNTRRGSSEFHKGRKKPEGMGAKVAAARRGVPRSEATKAKLAAYWVARRVAGEFKTTQPYANSSKSHARKAASAMIAKIPLVLSRHIAKVYHP